MLIEQNVLRVMIMIAAVNLKSDFRCDGRKRVESKVLDVGLGEVDIREKKQDESHLGWEQSTTMLAG